MIPTDLTKKAYLDERKPMKKEMKVVFVWLAGWKKRRKVLKFNVFGR